MNKTVLLKKTVLDVGNCGPDHSAICRLLSSHFNVRILQAHGLADTLDFLGKEQVDLVLINRKLDQDYSDGIEILKSLKGDHRFSSIPVMIISNFEEVQKAAVELGALDGFGKLSFSSPQTLERLSVVLN